MFTFFAKAFKKALHVAKNDFKNVAEMWRSRAFAEKYNKVGQFRSCAFRDDLTKRTRFAEQSLFLPAVACEGIHM